MKGKRKKEKGIAIIELLYMKNDKQKTINHMKKLIILSTLLCMGLLLQAQTNPIEELFDKYSEKDGFTTVTISGKLLNLFADKDSKNSKNENGKNVINRLTSIRILSVEDSLLNQKLNFYTELGKRINLSSYEELMATKEGQNVTKFLIRQKGDIITELLILSGGPGNNSLISITGDLDLKSLSELSKDTGIDELEDLDNVDKKKP